MAFEKVGRYEILETLGRGAMGVVYLARDPVIDRRLALKTLRIDLDDELAAEFRERFMREAQAAGRLNHSSIVTIHDVGEDPATGLVFIAMEYISGRDLKDIHASGHRFKPSEAAGIAAQIAHALDYAHAMGVVHRDIKPANILLTNDGTVKITDFGVARLESSNLTTEGQFIGTPNYMSPEQITARPVDGRSDLFSLGVVLYELLTGQRPFIGANLHEVTRKIVQEPCAIPSTVVQGLPPAFNPIILRCLEKDPAKRFQNGSDLTSVLVALSRSLAKMEGTAIAEAAVESRVTPPPPPQEEALTADTDTVLSTSKAAKTSALKELWRKIPMPSFVSWEVNPGWFWRITIAWALLWLGVISFLIPSRDNGPFLAPAADSTATLHAVVVQLRQARSLLAAGDIDAARAACEVVLDQAPASTAARATMNAILYQTAERRTDSETQRRVANLLSDGRELYGQGRYEESAARFENALDLDSRNELAADYLALTRERLSPAQRPSQPTGRRTQVQTTRRRPTPVPSRRSQQRQVVTGTARVTVYFNSPINAGSVTVSVDGATAAEIPFDFTKKGLLGIKRKGTGKVKQVFTAPAGRRTITVRLDDAERGTLGETSFSEQLGADSNWTLRIDLSEGAAAPSFYLVQATGPML